MQKIMSFIYICVSIYWLEQVYTIMSLGALLWYALMTLTVNIMLWSMD